VPRDIDDETSPDALPCQARASGPRQERHAPAERDLDQLPAVIRAPRARNAEGPFLVKGRILAVKPHRQGGNIDLTLEERGQLGFPGSLGGGREIFRGFHGTN
jgi:hypothetical protein